MSLLLKSRKFLQTRNLRITFQLWRLGNSRLGGRKWYQFIDFGGGLTNERWSAGETRLRTESFQAFLATSELLRPDDVVVDIGCNAGLHSLSIAQSCKWVYGMEIDTGFIRQARFLRRYWKSLGRRVDNVTFVHGDIMENLNLLSEATVVLASKILYHKLLGNGLPRVMGAIQKGPVRLILMQGHSVHGKLGQNDGMRDLVSNYGFEYQFIEDVPEFPIAIATRSVSL